jgi:hypothetical protein
VIILILFSLLRSGFLPGETQLKAQRRIKAKWASLYGMLSKWEKLRGPIARVDNFPDSVLECIPTPEEKTTLSNLIRKLADFESVAKGLQGGGVNRVSRYEARKSFNDLLNTHERQNHLIPHLHKNGTIVNNPDFENGIVKIQAGVETDLNDYEKEAVKIFLKPVTEAPVRVDPVTPIPTSFFQRSVERANSEKRQRLSDSSYRSTEHVSATSNIAERLFSAAKLNMSHLRSHMDPQTLNIILFLKFNKSLWTDKPIIDEIINDEKAAAEAAENDNTESDGEDAT